MAVFEFWYRNVQIWQTRSPINDTNYASIALRVGADKFGPVTRSCGDMSANPQIHGVDLKLQAEIPNDGTLVVIGWSIANSSQGGDQLTNALGNTAISLVGEAATAIPGIGPVLGVTINVLFGGFFRDHDGICEAGNASAIGQQLNNMPSHTNWWIQHKTYGNGLPDPDGHKDSGDYSSTLVVYRPGEYAG